MNEPTKHLKVMTEVVKKVPVKKNGLLKRLATFALNAPTPGKEIYRDPNWQNPKKENPVKKVVGKLADRVVAGSKMLSGK